MTFHLGYLNVFHLAEMLKLFKLKNSCTFFQLKVERLKIPDEFTFTNHLF